MDSSRQTLELMNGEDTSYAGVSMYLSFDSNSTMSNAAYKTIEAVSDVSTASDKCVDDESHQNSTLEATNDSQVQTVKRTEVMRLGMGATLRTFPKNILQEYRPLSSTPTKDQLLRSIDCNRVSETGPNMDLGVQVIDMYEKNVSFKKENKENSQPETEINDFLLAEEMITSEIEKKQVGVSSMADELAKAGEEKINLNNFHKTVPDAPQPNNVDNERVISINKGITKKNSNIPQIKNKRKTLCEQNPCINQPSSILKSSKDLMAVATNTEYVERNEIAAIPALLDKMLRISEVPNKNNDNPLENKSKHPVSKGRTSLLSQSEKRPFSFTQRMSIVVKTTLNSPARKIARKSSISAGTVGVKAPRRSVMISAPLRRSMMPSSSSLPSKALKRPEGELSERAQHHLPRLLEHSKKPFNSKSGPEKQLDSIFSCDICSRQFRVKSLLDAHKQCHDYIKTPATTLPKKPSTSTLIPNASIPSTQCKYCDKKFAIVRALHIHLLEKCSKIPPVDKRKLHFTELNHVVKAQLPSVFSNVSTKKLTKSHSTLNSTSLSSMESLAEKKEVSASAQEIVSTVENAHDSIAPPSKLKKKAAHSGVYRTPSKTVPCHLCKQSFKTILDYTNHSMMMHSALAKNAELQSDH